MFSSYLPIGYEKLVNNLMKKGLLVKLRKGKLPFSIEASELLASKFVSCFLLGLPGLAMEFDESIRLCGNSHAPAHRLER
jgi:hypothetical protein